MEGVLSRLNDVGQQKWWLHETVLAKKLRITRTDVSGIRDQVTELIHALKSGKTGSKCNGTLKPTKHGRVNLETGENALHMKLDKFGKSETFQNSSLSQKDEARHQPRYFRFGNTTVTLKDQYEMVREFVGDSTQRSKENEFRQTTWRAWYSKERNDDELQPRFNFLTASEAPSKDCGGNSELNVATMTSMLSDETLAHYGGGVTDNAGDAMLESDTTFKSIMDKVEVTMPEKVRFYGMTAKRRVIKNGDPFHVDNLVTKHASLGAFGETEKGNHSECHHRQVMQSIHDLSSRDPD